MPAFVSYSFKDQAIYSVLCLALDAAGFQRWDEMTMSPGQPLADQLKEAINTCEVCIFLATRRSIEAPWCLAELGAFWGAGKKVLLFMADPDLAETMLPPQFKGNVRVNTAEALLDALKKASLEARSSQTTPYDFFATSGSYGSEKEWAMLLDDTHQKFDVLGVTIGQWRKSNRFRERVRTKAEAGCKIRFLLMDQDSELLKGLLYNERNLRSVRNDIEESYEYYHNLTLMHNNIEVRQITIGIPHFFLTRSDNFAVIVQYLSSSTWGTGPAWRCAANSPLFKIVADEFEHLWTHGTNSPLPNSNGGAQPS